MSKSIVDSMDLQALLDYADEHALDPCDYCRYTFDCNHRAINCYGGNPIESPCVGDSDKWVDEDELREKVKEAIEDGTDN